MLNRRSSLHICHFPPDAYNFSCTSHKELPVDSNTHWFIASHALGHILLHKNMHTCHQVSCSCSASLSLAHKLRTLAFFKCSCGHASTGHACRMCKCALITAWWCGHAALIKLRQRNYIRSNAPNPSLSPRVQLCCQIKEDLNQTGERCIHFCLCGRRKGVIFEQAGQGKGVIGRWGGPAQKWVRMGMGFTSKCQWPSRDQRVSCIHRRLWSQINKSLSLCLSRQVFIQ